MLWHVSLNEHCVEKWCAVWANLRVAFRTRGVSHIFRQNARGIQSEEDSTGLDLASGCRCKAGYRGVIEASGWSFYVISSSEWHRYRSFTACLTRVAVDLALGVPGHTRIALLQGLL